MMSMNPRLVWENICILTGGETAHHKTNLSMTMHLESGELASNAKEKNVSVQDAFYKSAKQLQTCQLLCAWSH
jgi:hypothetical protein